MPLSGSWLEMPALERLLLPEGYLDLRSTDHQVQFWSLVYCSPQVAGGILSCTYLKYAGSFLLCNDSSWLLDAAGERDLWRQFESGNWCKLHAFHPIYTHFSHKIALLENASTWTVRVILMSFYPYHTDSYFARRMRWHERIWKVNCEIEDCELLLASS